MYFSGWIDMDDPSTLDSSWVDSFAWHSEEIDRDPSGDDVGTFVIWIEDSGELRKYMYDELPYELFNQLRRVAEHGDQRSDSVGRTYTKRIKENEDVPPSSRMGAEDVGDSGAASASER